MKKKIIFSLILLVILSLSFLLYNKKDIYEENNNKISVILDDESESKEVGTFPSKDEYYFDKVECENFNENNNIKPTFDREKWKLNVSVSATDKVDGHFKCNVHFKKIPVYEFDYTGSAQSFTAQADGNYKIELWGAAVKVQENTGAIGYIHGAYTSGNIELSKGTKLYIYVGEMSERKRTTATFNGGGTSTIGTYGDRDENNLYNQNYSGAGATDIRLVNGTWNNFDSLKSRIMVAAGAAYGTVGGGLYSDELLCSTAPNCQTNSWSTFGATQTRGGYTSANTFSGSFGIGGNGETTSEGYGSTGGGGGYYGGSGAYSRGWFGCDAGRCNQATATGGSSFISGHEGCNAITETSTSSNITHTGNSSHYSGKVFTNTVMIDGYGYSWTNVRNKRVNIPNPKGGNFDIGTGYQNNGYAKVSFYN